MASIADLEQLLEQVFERSTTRLFRTKVQPVQLEHRIERAMERSRVGRGSRTEVPSSYRLRINPVDLDGLAPDADAAQALAARLADAALAFARAHAYHLTRRPSVTLVADSSLERGRIEVDVDARVASRGRSPSVPPVGRSVRDEAANGSEGPPILGAPVSGVPSLPDAREPVLPAVAAAAPDGSADPAAARQPEALAVAGSSPADGQPLSGGGEDRSPKPKDDPASAPAAQTPSAGQTPPARPTAPDQPPGGEPAAPGLRATGAQTHGFRRPSPESTRAVLRMLGADGRERSIEVDGRPLTVGRARDNGLVIEDARVSRHHGRLLARHGALVYADLDSTNGSRVNGVRVDEIALGVGDRILVGDTVLVVESLPG
jgi:hypothetical protein